MNVVKMPYQVFSYFEPLDKEMDSLRMFINRTHVQ